jgi:methionyl aminopeptidase
VKPKTPEEIENLRESGRIVAQVRDIMARHAVAGISTAELEQVGAAELERLGGKPVHVDGYPSICCISVNQQVVHGIPGPYLLKTGDIVGFDFWASYNGMITDSAVTIGVGEISKEARRLLKATEEAMYAGIDKVKNGARTGDVSAAIEAVLKRENLGIVREMAGHGVGHELHEDPWLPNFGTAGQGTVLKTGMTIAIEPMAALGSDKIIFEDDGWTVSMADESLAAHFEHTVLVIEDGFEILTQL